MLVYGIHALDILTSLKMCITGRDAAIHALSLLHSVDRLSLHAHIPVHKGRKLLPVEFC